MDLGAPASGWMESGLMVLLGGFQHFWTLGTNVGGLRKHNPSDRSKAQIPPPKNASVGTHRALDQAGNKAERSRRRRPNAEVITFRFLFPFCLSSHRLAAPPIAAGGWVFLRNSAQELQAH